MSLLVSRVLRDEVEVFAANNERSVHFSRDNGACEDTATDSELVLVLDATPLPHQEAELVVTYDTSPTNGHFLSMYVPSIAVFGVLNPNPTSLNQRRPPVPARLLFAALLPFLCAWKTCGCFWYARSDCTVNSVAMIAVVDSDEVAGSRGY